MPNFDRLHELARRLEMLTRPDERNPGLLTWCKHTGETWKAIVEMWEPPENAAGELYESLSELLREASEDQAYYVITEQVRVKARATLERAVLVPVARANSYPARDSAGEGRAQGGATRTSAHADPRDSAGEGRAQGCRVMDISEFERLITNSIAQTVRAQQRMVPALDEAYPGMADADRRRRFVKLRHELAQAYIELSSATKSIETAAAMLTRFEGGEGAR